MTARPMLLRWFRSRRCVQRDGTGRVAVGGVAHKPWRVEEAEAELPQRRESRRRRAACRCEAHRDNAFKVPLVERTLGRGHDRSEELNMKFDTPAETNPIDQLQGRRKPTTASTAP